MTTRAVLRVFKVVATLALVGLAVFLAWFWSTQETSPEICEGLRRARVASVRLVAPADLSCEGVLDLSFAGSPLAEALELPQAGKASALLLQEKATGVGLKPGQKLRGVLGELAALKHVSGLRGVVLAPQLSVFGAVRETALPVREADALAYVARALFRGAREPSLSSFPASLRKVERVEVIVSLLEKGRPLLWRSARGTSIARTLMTATRVARDRWREREQAMGGPLEKRLLGLDVEVGLLSEDGTLASLDQSFVNRAITRAHGIGFDYRNGWHYLSPADVLTRGKGSAFMALQALLADQGLAVSTLADPNLRVYRFVPLTLGVSKAPLGSEPND